ncbi:hypothetical protein KKH16_00025, partial [Patescibacteria group bacterium]|nr:hypothetical protein [Patescibacteria group bacterium]
MKELKKIDKKSLTKIVSLFCGIAGFLFVFLAALFVAINIILQKDFVGSALAVTMLNLGISLLLAVFLSFVFAGVGWIIGWLSGIVYNAYAARYGGIKME